jgi:hypothetical protein
MWSHRWQRILKEIVEADPCMFERSKSEYKWWHIARTRDGGLFTHRSCAQHALRAPFARTMSHTRSTRFLATGTAHRAHCRQVQVLAPALTNQFSCRMAKRITASRVDTRVSAGLLVLAHVLYVFTGALAAVCHLVRR